MIADHRCRAPERDVAEALVRAEDLGPLGEAEAERARRQRAVDHEPLDPQLALQLAAERVDRPEHDSGLLIDRDVQPVEVRVRPVRLCRERDLPGSSALEDGLGDPRIPGRDQDAHDRPEPPLDEVVRRRPSVGRAGRDAGHDRREAVPATERGGDVEGSEEAAPRVVHGVAGAVESRRAKVSAPVHRERPARSPLRIAHYDAAPHRPASRERRRRLGLRARGERRGRSSRQDEHESHGNQHRADGPGEDPGPIARRRFPSEQLL